MSVDVTVLRVFPDPAGNFGNPLGVVDAATVDPEQHQRLATQLGYSETIFVDLPTVGASWWLHDIGTPISTLRVPAGVVQVSYDDDLTFVSARSEWAPDFAVHDLASLEDLGAADPSDFPDDAAHYLWAWIDESAGSLRSRLFAANLGVPEDEATGSAAVRITDYLSRDLSITQGKGSMIDTVWDPQGWVKIAGRVVNDGVRQVR